MGAIATFLAATARAGQPAPDDAAEATKLFKKGWDLLQIGQANDARRMFIAADAIAHSADITWNLAIAELDSDHLLEASKHFRQYLTEPRADEPTKREAEDFIKGIEKQIARITIRVAKAADVRLDGEKVVLVAGAIEVLPGLHELRAPGMKKLSVKVAAGDHVDAEFVSETPSAERPNTAGPTEQRPPVVVSEHPHAVNGSSARLWVPVSAAIGAGVFIGSGIYFGVKSNDAAHNAQQERQSLASSTCVKSSTPGCSSLSDSVSAARRDDALSIVSYSIGGIAAATAVVTGVLMARSHETNDVTGSLPSPMIGPGLVGAQWQRSF